MNSTRDDRKPGVSPACPCCGSQEIQTIYSQRGIPVHSCILMSSHDEAVVYPRGDLDLGFCDVCGFVFNSAFDPDVQEYSRDYEETQGFSPTFSTFAESLARRLVDQCDLRGKTVLEIGCGKGEFLAQLCQVGDCRGIGFDPSYVPGRLPAELTHRIEFIEDFYGPAHADRQADLILCRHTLEHIHATARFATELRLSIADRTDTQVFIEVPDIKRILAEGAFWDIYYEHCSYFSPGSLARLFRRHGFAVTELTLEYGDQYILLLARVDDGAHHPPPPLEDDLEPLRAAAAELPARVAATVQHWRSVIEQASAGGDRVILWGSGSKAVAFLSTIDTHDAIRRVVDINPHKHGKFMPGTGQEIVAPESLQRDPPDLVIVMNPVYADEIGADLRRLGIDAEIQAV